MSRKTPAIFEVANEEFYLHISDMEAGDRVKLEHLVFVKREDGTVRASYDLIDYMRCSTPACSLAAQLAGWPDDE